MKILTVNLPVSQLKMIEKLVNQKDRPGIYPSRSELVRVAVREFLLKELPFLDKVEVLELKNILIKKINRVDKIKSMTQRYLNNHNVHLLLDFDGIFVENIKDINNNENSMTENTIKLKEQRFLNWELIDCLKNLRKQYSEISLAIFTGRKDSILGEYTRELMSRTGLQINTWLFYPEDLGYKREEYLTGKLNLFSKYFSSLDKNDYLFVMDDDLGVLEIIKDNFPLGSDQLLHYCFNDKDDLLENFLKSFENGQKMAICKENETNKLTIKSENLFLEDLK